MPLQRLGHTGAAAATTLASGISATAVAVPLIANTGWPTGAGGQPFVMAVDVGLPGEEKILCSSFTGTTANVAAGGRGWDNTLATVHSAGAAAEHVLAAAEIDDDSDHIYTTSRDDHPQYALTSGARAITGTATFNAGLTDSGTLTQTGPVNITGNTAMTGQLSVSSTLAAAGNQTVAGTLAVTGAAALNGGATVGGAGLTSPADMAARTVAATGLPTTVGNTRWVGTTATAPPTSGTFSTGDWVIDQTGAVWLCLAGGSPGTWSVPVGGMVGFVKGPASTVVANNNTVNVVSLAATLRAGNNYLVTACHQGSVASGPPNFVNTQLTDGNGLTPQPFLMSLPSAALSVAALVAGSTTATLSPTSTATNTFTVKATASGPGTFSTAADWANIVVVRIG